MISTRHLRWQFLWQVSPGNNNFQTAFKTTVKWKQSEVILVTCFRQTARKLALASLPLISFFSNHSTVMLFDSKFIPLTIAEWIRPANIQNINANYYIIKVQFRYPTFYYVGKNYHPQNDLHFVGKDVKLCSPYNHRRRPDHYFSWSGRRRQICVGLTAN